jgi:hypothetical protein
MLLEEQLEFLFLDHLGQEDPHYLKVFQEDMVSSMFQLVSLLQILFHKKVNQVEWRWNK